MVIWQTRQGWADDQNVDRQIGGADQVAHCWLVVRVQPLKRNTRKDSGVVHCMPTSLCDPWGYDRRDTSHANIEAGIV